MLTSLLAALDAWCARAERRPWRWLVLLATLLALQVGPIWYATPDGTAYLSIARSIAAGGEVADLGSPLRFFPTGYPLLISPVFHAGRRPLLLLSLAHWLLAVVCMLGVFRWARSQFAESAPWVTALVMANVHIWILYRRTLSESAFCAVLPWTVLAWNGVVARIDGAAPAGRGWRGAVRALLAVGLLALLIAIREAGALIGVGVALAALVGGRRRAGRWRRVGLALAASLAAVVAFAIVVRFERLQAATNELIGAAAGADVPALWSVGSFFDHLRLRIVDLGQLLIPGMFKAYDDGWVGVTTMLYLPLAVLMAAAWWRLARRRGEVFAWTVPPYLALHLLWPYSGSGRYLLPLLPVLWLALWIFCAALPRRRLLFAALLAAHLGVAVGYLVAIDAPRARACHAAWPAVDLVAARARQPDEPLWVADGVPECVRLMLELAIDQPVGVHGGGDASWLLLPQDATIPERFVADTVAGDYVLARRRDPAAP